MGKLDSMESKPPLQPPQRAAGTGSNVLVNGNINNGELTLSKAAPERIKRDEWSEGAVTTLLDAYESKWLLRNRAKLKGNDWEEVARHVSTRGEGSKSAKTQTQCKNKIESMKKRYRSESASANNNNASASASAWPLYGRMDNLLRCRTAPLNVATQLPDLELQDPPPPSLMLSSPPPPPPPPPPPQENGQHRVVEEPAPDAEAKAKAEPPPPAEAEEAERQEAGVEGSNQEDGSNTLPNRRESAALDTDTSTPRSKIANDPAAKEIAPNFNFSCKRRKTLSPSGGGGSEVAESIRSFADTIVKLEQAKMRMYKDSERLRAETEVRRGEMELKRTEIIAKTQLQIAKLLSGKNGKGADSSSMHALFGSKVELLSTTLGFLFQC